MNEKKKVIIIGGGAAGLIASIAAAESGAAVTVLEHNEKTGRKLCVTGNGRCNLGNLRKYQGCYRGTHPGFAETALAKLSVKGTIEFFEKTGISVVDKNGWLYPRSGQAKCVPDLLEQRARSLKVKIKTREHVTDIYRENGSWTVKTEGWHYEGDAVILACGSAASSVEGSDGSGYALAEKLGHHIVPLLPALTGLKCRGKFSGWAGVRTEGEIRLFVEGVLCGKEAGELQLTDYGVSGIPVFQLSRYALSAIHEGKKAELFINFLPDRSKEETEAFIAGRRKITPYLSDGDILSGLFPDRLCRVLLKQKDLTAAIHEFPLTVTGSNGMAQAQVCAGGVDTREVNPDTMESLICPGIYFAGELLDIDGACGGYNLQWAWPSGRLAGCCSVKEKI